MIIDRAELSNGTEVNIDAEGIRIRHVSGAAVFLTFDQLRDINALVEALGRHAHYQALADKYASPLFGEGAA